MGLSGAFLHGAVVYPLGLAFPLGFVTVLAGCAAAFFGGRLLTATRAGAVICVGGWLLASIMLATQRPEGDLIVPAGFVSYTYLLLGSFLAIAAVTLPTLPLSEAERG